MKCSSPQYLFSYYLIKCSLPQYLFSSYLMKCSLPHYLSLISRHFSRSYGKHFGMWWIEAFGDPYSSGQKASRACQQSYSTGTRQIYYFSWSISHANFYFHGANVTYLSNSSFIYLQLLLGQLAILPLQQQITLKKLLEASIPNIDSLVAAAGRSDWNR